MNVTNELVRIYRNYNPFEFSDGEIRAEIGENVKKFIGNFREELAEEIYEAEVDDDKMRIYDLNRTRNNLNRVAERVFRK